MFSTWFEVRTYHEIMLPPRQLLRHPSQWRNQGPTVTPELIRQQVYPGDQVLYLTPLPNLIESIVAVGRGVRQRGTEQGLEEERREETALHAEAQVRGQDIPRQSWNVNSIKILQS